MKKILFTSLSICMVTLTVTPGNLIAQSNSGFVARERNINAPAMLSESKEPSLAPMPSASINSKALKNLGKLYKNASNVNWYQIPDGLMAYFTDQGIKVRVGYDPKGHWLYNWRAYDENSLPTEIRARVKTVYYDYAIKWINEISDGHQTVYFVNIEDKNTLKVLRVCEGEDMEVTKECLKMQ